MATATKQKPKAELFAEYADARGTKLRVDREKSIIYGVKLLGGKSANNREYPDHVMKAAVPLYEGAHVNLNHGKKIGDVRDLQERFGTIRNPTFQEGDGNFGDLHYNPKHPYAESVAWFAEHQPEALGMSHVAECKSRTANGKVVIESISRVRSVDLVSEAATTATLFESPQAEPETMSVDLAALTVEQITAGNPTLVESIVKTALAEQASSAEAKAKDEKIKTLSEQVDKYQAAEKLAGRKSVVDTKLKEAKLPELLLTPIFVEQCYGADDETLAKLIEDRQTLGKTIKPAPGRTPPVSKDQTHSESAGNFANVTDGKTFAAALCR